METDSEKSDLPEFEDGQFVSDPDWLPRWELIALFVGDLVMIILFTIIGRTSHTASASGGAVLAVLNTAIPFMVAWMLVGMLTGMFRGQALYPPLRVIGRTALTGLFAGPLGVGLRALWLARPIIPSFVVVATLSSTFLLLMWRFGWSRLRRLWWPELP